MRHLLFSLFKALGLVLLVLVLVEVVLTAWDRGAYTEPNFYVEDSTLGIRLIPHANQSLAYLGVHPATNVQINEAGYRGDAFPPPAEGEIAVVGDSLVFGLGVNGHETFSARLQDLLNDGTQVLNYGVPSYGMHEQTILVEEILESRTPGNIVFTVSVGRMLGIQRTPLAGVLMVDAGWLFTEDTTRTHRRLPLPAWMERWSHISAVLRRRSRTMSQTEFASTVIETRWKNLSESVERSKAERERMNASGWTALQGPDGSPRSWSILLPHLRALKAIVQDSSTSVTVLILPQDFQLRPSQWTKYGLEPRDTESIQILVEDLSATAHAMGFAVVDATAALTAEGGETVLPRDWHFDANGHRVIAETLQEHFQPPPVEP